MEKLVIKCLLLLLLFFLGRGGAGGEGQIFGLITLRPVINYALLG